MAYIDDNQYGVRLDALATEYSNLAYRMLEISEQLRESTQQALANAGGTNGQMDTKYSKTSGWAANINSLGAHYVDLLLFFDNGIPSQLDRRADLNKFK